MQGMSTSFERAQDCAGIPYERKEADDCRDGPASAAGPVSRVLGVSGALPVDYEHVAGFWLGVHERAVKCRRRRRGYTRGVHCPCCECCGRLKVYRSWVKRLEW